MTRDINGQTDLLNTTEKARDIDRAAHDLGLGNIDDLINAGLQPKTNAAHKALEALLSKKDKDKNFAELLHMQLLRTLDAINQELDWLHQQIGIEQAAIGENLNDLDFVATLDEDTIMGADEELRDDVKALLTKHGYKNADDMDVADIMLTLQTVEVDLIENTATRRERVQGYQKRADHLGEVKADIRKHIAPDATPKMRQAIEDKIEYQPHEDTFRFMAETYSANDQMSGLADTQEVERTLEVESSTFALPTPS